MALDVKNLDAFPRTFGLADFGITADVVVQPGSYGLVGTYTIPAQQAVAFGQNAIGNGGPTGGVLYIRLDDSTGTRLDGKIRLVLTNANGTRSRVVLEERTERLVGSATDRNSAILLPLKQPLGREDDKLRIEFYPDGASAVTVDYNGTNTSVLVPVTVFQ